MKIFDNRVTQDITTQYNRNNYLRHNFKLQSFKEID